MNTHTRHLLRSIPTSAKPRLSNANIVARCISTSQVVGQVPPSSSSNASTSHGKTTHFGFKEVPEEQKETLVGSVFSSVASSYDVMNDAMSLGIHRLWKDSFVSSLLPRLPPSLHQNQVPGSSMEAREPFRCLDVAGGTGDIALRILDRAREKFNSRDIQVEIVDLNQGMLDEGRKRVAKTLYYNTPQITFTHGNAQSLPSHIPDNSIDLYTIAFGIRNCTSLPAVLSEAYRVLKPGGKIGVLEFGKVSNPLFKEIYRQYSFQFIPIMGKILAGDSESYQYLVESIERFPSQPEFAQLMRNAGFQTGQLREGKGGAWTDYTNGIATAWTGVKA
ncbi:ubiquinone biosynthesis methyltransferase [Kwoniella mangroviensis CBS 10435]|uniref:2-methoxy-6-polyprenyl-1,4-benzoquinol methylase, mitochondrial n=1 Tax=Kwoniella mangroviensis CBS 10435 TaxID=1331196 RepID=A0A1B9IY72_9TREE|nr:ubiquinone biosynthesis methyltransferase [Kwoniella mangroviensis CBS 8507]OCF60452.1 ubiquinone biosynthesis methyltransferase [Kwoniella mangroviensis CBS 10435]OCF70634.1 ubiquinone biosynthesis methyltransferase [Kwoniella mangroviensis CBS 8507]